MPFKEAVVTSDQANIAILAADKGHREAMYVFSCKTGDLVSKTLLRYSGVKVRFRPDSCLVVFLPCWSNFDHFFLS